MSLFFKLDFKPFFDKWKNQKKSPKPVNFLIIEYIQYAFPGLFEAISGEEQTTFVELLKLIVFSHRHNKNDPYLKNHVADWGIVRDPMYRYSKNVQDRFFGEATYAFLFAYFTQHQQALEFAKKKYEENPDTRYPERMLLEVEQLGREAMKHLRKTSCEP